MKRWLEDNPLGIALGAICAALLLVLLVLWLLELVPVAPTFDETDAAAGVAELELPELAESPPLDEYAVITERPLFSETRQPGPEGAGLADALLEDADAEAPGVELSGVVITPSLRMVTLRREDQTESLVAFEGRAIEEADFGGWQISSIGEREATLTSSEGKELKLELKVHDEVIEQPERPRAAQKQEAAEAGAETQSAAEPGSRAEEIRQRIAERREELRRQAEGEVAPEAVAAEEQQPDYQQAIQALIGRGKREKAAEGENKKNDGK